MSQAWEPTIGATEATQVNKAETLNFAMAFTDSNGDPINLTGATIEALESQPASIAEDMEITITDPPGGIATCVLTAVQMASLGIGRVNWFRLKTTFSANNIDTTPRIWIQIT